MKPGSIILLALSVIGIIVCTFFLIGVPDAAQKQVDLYERCTAVADLTVTNVVKETEKDANLERYETYYMITASYQVNGLTYKIAQEKRSSEYSVGDSFGQVHYNPSKPSEYYTGSARSYDEEVKLGRIGAGIGIFIFLVIAFFVFLKKRAPELWKEPSERTEKPVV